MCYYISAYQGTGVLFSEAVRLLIPTYEQTKPGGKKNISSEELRQLLAYFEHSTEKYAINNDLREIHEMVSRVRQDEEVELSYMKIFEREQMIWEDGMNEGEELKLIQQILKKVHKGKDMYTIAEELEEVPTDIERLYEAVKNNQDRTKEEIYKIYSAGRKKREI